MKPVWRGSAKLLTGLVLAAMYATPQAYTISAKPGAINYIEGNAYVDGQRLSTKALKSAFLAVNDTLSTDTGKAEVLLTPGIFLRIGDNSQIRMLSPSLTNTQIEVTRGEAMLEVADLVKGNDIQILDQGGSIRIEKDGLYRFIADNPPTAAVLEGKAEVSFGDRHISLGKGHEVLIGQNLRTQRFDPKKEDDLYAWSNVRSEYDAAATYQAARNVGLNNYGGWYGYGFGDWYGSGWYWDNGFNTWAWLPGGGFYSPFGWGFFGPGFWDYAPVVVAPVYGGGYWSNGRWHGKGTTATVPVNPRHPPAIGTVPASPFANQVARSEAVHAIAASGGLHTAVGAPVAVGRASGFSGPGSGSGAAPAHASVGGFSGSGGGHAAAGAPSGGSHK